MTRLDHMTAPEKDMSRPALAGRPAVAEFVAMMAALMALNALAIDVMLPALDDMARDLSIASANQQQWVIISYVLGFSVPQIIYGPVTDRFGRRPVALVSLIGYALAGLMCMAAPSFAWLLAARVLQGVFAAGCRVVAVSTVRDLFAGRAMARIMSLVMTVFMIIPILAPGLGEVILLVADWHGIFLALTIAGVALALWVGLRLPETLAPDKRHPLNLKSSLRAYRLVLSYGVTRGYLAASGVIFGALFAFIATSEQVFREVFEAEDLFALWFAIVALTMAGASFTNSRLVERFGMRRISHLALIGFTLLSAILIGLMTVLGEHLFVFLPLFAVIFALFGLIGANFNALAMEPLGEVAGAGSAAHGFVSTTLAALIGGFIGAQYNGSVVPILLGFVGLGLVTLAIILITEKGRLMGAA